VWALTDEDTALLTDPSTTDDQRREKIRTLWSAHLVELRRARKARQAQDAAGPNLGVAEEMIWKGSRSTS
jgi:predicted alpha-1,6-mannanase (GH76 family)